MTNTSDISQKTVCFSWPIFFQRLIQASLVLLCIGSAFILLFHLNGTVDAVLPNSPEPIAFLGGTIALVALTLMGVPVVAATATGIAIWLTIQNFL